MSSCVLFSITAFIKKRKKRKKKKKKALDSKSQRYHGYSTANVTSVLKIVRFSSMFGLYRMIHNLAPLLSEGLIMKLHSENSTGATRSAVMSFPRS